jgi:hypothetical protein
LSPFSASLNGSAAFSLCPFVCLCLSLSLSVAALLAHVMHSSSPEVMLPTSSALLLALALRAQETQVGIFYVRHKTTFKIVDVQTDLSFNIAAPVEPSCVVSCSCVICVSLYMYLFGTSVCLCSLRCSIRVWRMCPFTIWTCDPQRPSQHKAPPLGEIYVCIRRESVYR